MCIQNRCLFLSSSKNITNHSLLGAGISRMVNNWTEKQIQTPLFDGAVELLILFFASPLRDSFTYEWKPITPQQLVDITQICEENWLINIGGGRGAKGKRTSTAGEGNPVPAYTDWCREYRVASRGSAHPLPCNKIALKWSASFRASPVKGCHLAFSAHVLRLKSEVWTMVRHFCNIPACVVWTVPSVVLETV